MKFGKTLANESVPEWRSRYIAYSRLKKLLHPIAEARGQMTTTAAASSGSLANINIISHTSHEGMTQASDLLQNSPAKTNSDDDLIEASSASNLQHSQAGEGLELSTSRTSHSTHAFTGPLKDILLLHSQEERHFFEVLEEEIKKVNAFYTDKEKEAKENMERFRIQCVLIARQSQQQQKVKMARKMAMRRAEVAEMALEEKSWVPERIRRIWAEKVHVNEAAEAIMSAPQLLQNLLPRVLHTEMAKHIDNHQEGDSRPLRRSQVKQAGLDLYHSLEMLRNYQVLNHTGLHKILKKFDKTAGWEATQVFLDTHSPKQGGTPHLAWNESQTIVQLIAEMEQLFMATFTNGKRSSALAELRLPDAKLKHDCFHDVAWRSGSYLGIGLCLLVQTLIIVNQGDFYPTFPLYNYFYQIYGALLLPVAFAILFTGCLYAWALAGVNYVFIFEFDYRHHLHYIQYMEMPCFFFLVWSVFVYVTFSRHFDDSLIPLPMLPLVFVSMLCAVIFFPLPGFYRKARFWFLRTCGRIVVSPLNKVHFRDFFLTDILISLSYTVRTAPLFICFNTHTLGLGQRQLHDPATAQAIVAACDVSKAWVVAVLSLVPSYWRLVQCARRFKDSGDIHPHVPNMVKYLLNCIVASSVVWRKTEEESPGVFYFWVVLSTVTILYSYWWDVYIDWGLCRSKSKNRWLRDELFFRPAFLHFAIVSNFVMRTAWILGQSPGSLIPGLSPVSVRLFAAVVEVVRRAQWAIYRMENEHATNCGKYRAVNDIPLPKYQHLKRELEDDFEDVDPADRGDSDWNVRVASRLPLSLQRGQRQSGAAFVPTKPTLAASRLASEHEHELDSIHEQDDDRLDLAELGHGKGR
ncbi:Xenotropic and polytropic retrovirus receptor 1 [Sorochytrium milnesiophthora]